MAAVEVWHQVVAAFTSASTFVEAQSGTITALATIVLAALTWVLARATKAMAAATSTANVVASLETNQWSFMHLDLVVHNTGNAPAYEVKVLFDPPLPYMSGHEPDDTPFGTISIIRPGHTLTTGVNDFQSVKRNVYRVTVQWKRTPKSRRVEQNSYDINIAALGAISRLGAASPGVQVAEQIKKLREDWKSVAGGQRRLKVDGFDRADRKQERESLERARQEMRQRAAREHAQDGPTKDG